MKIHYMLDTNICIYIAKQRPESVLHRFEQLEIGEVGMSLITYGELLYGAKKSQHPKQAQKKLEDISSLIPPLPLDAEVSRYYAHIRASLEKQGKPIGNNDLWIAAHAVRLQITLVSNNLREFQRIPQLKTENWV